MKPYIMSVSGLGTNIELVYLIKYLNLFTIYVNNNDEVEILTLSMYSFTVNVYVCSMFRKL